MYSQMYGFRLLLPETSTTESVVFTFNIPQLRSYGKNADADMPKLAILVCKSTADIGVFGSIVKLKHICSFLYHIG